MFTKPDSSEKLYGLTIFDVHKLKSIFKGSPVNEEKGKDALVIWKVKDTENNVIRFSKSDMDLMKAQPGDLVYIQDSRWWLGGLKSVHSTFGETHNEDGVAYINSMHLDHGQFVEAYQLKAEKEM